MSRLHHNTMSKCSVQWNSSHKQNGGELKESEIHCSVKTPCITRWNSLFDSIEQQLLSFKEKLPAICEGLSIPLFPFKNWGSLAIPFNGKKIVNLLKNAVQKEESAIYSTSELPKLEISTRNEIFEDFF